MSKIFLVACPLTVRVCIVMSLQKNSQANIIRQPFGYQTCRRLCKDFDHCHAPKFISTKLRCILEGISCDAKLSTQNCSAGSRYSRKILTRTKGHRSIKWSVKKSVFRGCGPPSEVPNADVIYGGVFVHAVATYTCKSDFKHCGLQTVSRCKANGEWTAITGLCSQFRWHYPVVPFEESLPCQDQDVLHIKIKAKATSETRMTFELMSDKDDLLVIDCRFSFLGDVGQIVLTDRTNDVYGEEVRSSRFPFIVNKIFVMEITLINGNYQISVGGQTWNFKQRIVGVIPERVHCWNDVDVELLEILI